MCILPFCMLVLVFLFVDHVSLSVLLSFHVFSTRGLWGPELLLTLSQY